MAGIATAFSVIGTVVSAAGTIAAGQAQKRQADAQAAEYNVRAKEERGAASVQASEYRRQTRLAQSALQARAAGGGFAASDPTILDLASDIAGRGELQAAIARYGGEARAGGLEFSAKSARETGQAIQTASYYNAASTIVGGATSMFQRYGQFFAPTTPAALRYG